MLSDVFFYALEHYFQFQPLGLVHLPSGEIRAIDSSEPMPVTAHVVHPDHAQPPEWYCCTWRILPPSMLCNEEGV